MRYLFFQGWLDETLLQYSLIKMGVCVCVCWNLPWLQTPLMQLTVAVITVVTPCLLTTGGQRSGAKVALMIKLYKSRLHLVFFFQGSCFAFCTSFAHDILSVLRHVRAVRLCARGAVVSQCAMHNTWRGGLLLLRFTGELVHTLQFHLLLVYFITERVNNAAKVVFSNNPILFPQTSQSPFAGFCLQLILSGE